MIVDFAELVNEAFKAVVVVPNGTDILTVLPLILPMHSSDKAELSEIVKSNESIIFALLFKGPSIVEPFSLLHDKNIIILTNSKEKKFLITEK